MKKKEIKKTVTVPVSNGNVERHLRLAQVAALLGVSRPTVYRLLDRIRHIRINAGGIEKTLILIPESALAEFLASTERKPSVSHA